MVSESEPRTINNNNNNNDFIEFAFDESWKSHNSQLDYIDNIRLSNSPIPDTSWGNTEKFRETVYKTIPQLLKAKYTKCQN